MYNLPNHNLNDVKKSFSQVVNNRTIQGIALVVVLLLVLGFSSGKLSTDNVRQQFNTVLENFQANAPITLETPTEEQGSEYNSRIDYEQAIIDAVKAASPSVVSIVISKNLPVYEQQFINPFGPFGFEIPQYVQRGTEYKEVGAGSGFIVSSDGLVVTNKHVVSDKGADYTVITNDGEKYTAKMLALDPVQDIALIKIQGTHAFSSIKLGDSDGIQIGQGAIAIGNALGQFSNSVSVGIVSGLGRTVSASNQRGTFSETLEGIIQTDAAINSGNSGGPLINLKGEVIGVNTAMAQGAQSIGFAIPINIAKRDIAQVVSTNKITYPFLGVRHVLVDTTVKLEHNLAVDSGSLILRGENGEAAITPGSAADKAGLKEGDVILEIDGQKVSETNSVAKLIQKHNPGDTVKVKVLRQGKEMEVSVTLGERS